MVLTVRRHSSGGSSLTLRAISATVHQVIGCAMYHDSSIHFPKRAVQIIPWENPLMDNKMSNKIKEKKFKKKKSQAQNHIFSIRLNLTVNRLVPFHRVISFIVMDT